MAGDARGGGGGFTRPDADWSSEEGGGGGAWCCVGSRPEGTAAPPWSLSELEPLEVLLSSLSPVFRVGGVTCCWMPPLDSSFPEPRKIEAAEGRKGLKPVTPALRSTLSVVESVFSVALSQELLLLLLPEDITRTKEEGVIYDLITKHEQT